MLTMPTLGPACAKATVEKSVHTPKAKAKMRGLNMNVPDIIAANMGLFELLKVNLDRLFVATGFWGNPPNRRGKSAEGTNRTIIGCGLRHRQTCSFSARK